MGRASRCSGCKTPRSEHTFGKPEKHCNGSDQGSDAEENTASPSESFPVEDVKDLSIEDTLASLLGVVKSLNTGLQEVNADNQQLRALLKDLSRRRMNPKTVRFPFQMHALAARLLRGLFCQSCAPWRTCPNKPMDASLSLGWRFEKIVNLTMMMLTFAHS